MNMPGFSADTSLYSTSGQQQIGEQIVLSGNAIGQIYPARLKNEDEGVDCDSCFGAQCAELHCLEKSLGIFDPGGGPGGGGGGGGSEPCLNHSECSACVPSGRTIFSPGRQFCTHYFCSPGFGGTCRCQVFKGFQSCRVPNSVFNMART